MQIGQLDRRVILYNPTTSVNGYGELEETYELYTTRWAHILWKGGSEGEVNRKIEGSSKVHFYLRNQSLGSLTLLTKLVYDSKDYFLEVINQLDGRKGYIELIAVNKD